VDLFSDIPKKQPKALSVTQLLRAIKRAVESSVGSLWIEGEVSNLKQQSSGHWYLSLKDDNTQIQCAFFHARRKEGSQYLKDGAKVRVFADATVYEARGQLQVIIEKVEPSGQGDLQARFDALKQKLLAEGLFDSSRKKPIPSFPKTIGIVTSPTGAAIQDILNILTRRSPWIQPVLFPVRVQGKGAEIEIANAIQKLNNPHLYNYPHCDILIVGRGGGSLEDLWNFNEEIVARAIAASHIPIISAVGHEIDFTIADFVADLRAPTPSAAAELAAPDTTELLNLLSHAKKRITRSLSHSLREPTQKLDTLRDYLSSYTASSLNNLTRNHRELSLKLQSLHPSKIIERRTQHISSLQRIFSQLAQNQLTQHTKNLNHLQTILRTLGPISALKRGFSITMSEDGKIIRSTSEAKKHSTIRTKLIDGEVTSTVR
jgi:exodeoxyribonuclease VII large subunit